jgi:alkylation response protein AidB-like acyl-CoA dehydrogenase
MNFDYSSEQAALAETVNRFITDEYGFADRSKWAHGAAGYSTEQWRAFADLGLFGAGVSESRGGFGGGAVANAIIMEAFGRGLVVEPFLAHAVLCLQTLCALPPTDTTESLIGDVLAGTQITILAHGEPKAWGTTRYVETRAEAAGQGRFRLTGHKSRVLGAPMADKLLVSARTAGAADDAAGVALFLISPEDTRMHTQTYRLIDNSRVADIWLQGVEAEPLTGAEEAMTAIETGTQHARVAVCAESLGAMEAALWQTRDYLRNRKQFGMPLASFQALQHRMADMLVQLELARSMLFLALSAAGGTSPLHRQQIAAAKMTIGQAGLFVGVNAIQLHGGIGMSEELMIGHYYKRLAVLESLFGNAREQLADFMATNAIGPLPQDLTRERAVPTAHALESERWRSAEIWSAQVAHVAPSGPQMAENNDMHLQASADAAATNQFPGR